MLRRLAGTGLNVGVILISIVVFFVALFAMMGIANSQKPDTLDILAAAHDLSVGQPLTPNDIVVKTVFVDSNTDMYIPATDEGIASISGGVVVVPVFVGQPIQQTSIVAQVAGDTRLSAALVNYPAGGSLFPWMNLTRMKAAAGCSAKWRRRMVIRCRRWKKKSFAAWCGQRWTACPGNTGMYWCCGRLRAIVTRKRRGCWAARWGR